MPAFWVLPALVIVTVLAYWPALGGGLLWDDQAHITRPDLQSLHGLTRIWFDLGATQQYYPLLHSAFWLEHQLWGDAQVGYHLTNILLHAAAAWLVFLVLRQLKVPGALLAAAIFALHPVHVESVAWISEQKNTLSAVFYLAAMLSYLWFDEYRRSALGKPRAAKFYWLALGLFLLGLMTKTVTATLPAALLVVFWWQRGRLSWRRDVLPLLPFFVSGAAAGAITAWVERKLIGAEGAAFELSFLQRGLIAGRALWFYAAKLLWPADLTFIYPRWEPNPAAWWQWLFPVAALLLLLALWAIRRRWRAPLAGVLFFVGTLFPVLGFLNVYPFIYSFVADHFQYLASLGLITLFAVGVALGLTMLSPTARRGGMVVAVGLVGALAGLTWNQCRMYADSVALYGATIERNPTCWMAYNNLGDQYLLQGQLPQAIEQYRTAIKLNPMCVEAHSNLGVALAEGGQLDQAVSEYSEALRIAPGNAEAQYNFGNLLAKMGRTSEAIAHYQRAAELNPGSADVQLNLGIAYRTTGASEEAIAHLARSVTLDPDSFATRLNLADALVRRGRPQEAIEHFVAAARLKPDSSEAQNNWGTALLALDRPDEALGHFRSALVLDASSAEAYYNLGTALAATKQFPAAIEAFEHALRLSPNDAATYASLAESYEAAGRSAEALATAQKGLEVARHLSQADEIKLLEAWLAKHRAKP